MKIIIIDTEAATFDYLEANFNDTYTFTLLEADQEKLSAVAGQATSNPRPEAIFINLEGTYENRGRSNLKGLELLFWLRLKYDFTGPIITYGFLSSAQVLRQKPEYAVLHAPGNYHVRLPDGFESFFKSNNLGELGLERNRLKEYRPFVQKAINLKAVRHREANWWGIKVLWVCYKLMNDYNRTLQYNIGGNLLERDNFTELLPDDIQDELDSLNGFLIAYDNELSDRIGEANEQNRSQRRELAFSTPIDIVPLPRFPKILLIDDQAGEGWSDIYQHIIYGGENRDFHTFNNFPASNSNHEEGIEHIKENVIEYLINQMNNKVDCILLDLRLQPGDKNKEVHKVSGVKILKHINKHFKGIPILVTSASNKIWSYQEVIKAGADAYWLKEGVDNLQNAEDSIKSYVNFIEIIAAFMNEEYQFLREMNKNLKKFREPPAPRFWWVRKTWPTVNFDGRGVNTNLDLYTTAENVEKFYQDGILLFQNFLKGKYLQKNLQDGDWFYYSSIIIHLAKLIEKFHGHIIYDPDNTNPTYGQLTEIRRDTLGKKLYKIRNTAAHFKHSIKIDFEDNFYTKDGHRVEVNFKTFIEKMNKYLFEYTPPN